MKLIDRIILITLAGLFLVLIGAAITLSAKVEATADRPIPVTTIIDEPPTTVAPPQVCVVGDGPDANWAARFGVHDRTCS